MGGHLRFQCGETFPDFKGCGQFVFQMVHSRILAQETLVHAQKPVIDFVIQSLALRLESPHIGLDTGQLDPDIADARGDGFLKDLLDCFDG